MFGIDLSRLSARQQLVLPQFLPLDRRDREPTHIYNDQAKLTELRKRINESLWTGLALENSGLVSLKEILQKTEEVDDEGVVEQYIMLSSVISEEETEESIDFSKDFHLIINRTKIDFNKKSCRLVTFKDVSVHHRLKHQEEKGELLTAMTTHIFDKVIDPLNSMLGHLQKLKSEMRSQEGTDSVHSIYVD